jgi:ATP-dependent Clp protease ATP-binding subunit ClpC
MHEKMRDNVLSELKKTFNPEFLNRVDEIVVFHTLEKLHLLSIIDLLIEETNRKLIEYSLTINVSQEVKEWLLNKYYQPVYGARPMRRAIYKEIEDQLSEELLKGNFKDTAVVNVELKDNVVQFNAVPEPVLALVN